jgi:hypothetical protein
MSLLLLEKQRMQIFVDKDLQEKKEKRIVRRSSHGSAPTEQPPSVLCRSVRHQLLDAGFPGTQILIKTLIWEPPNLPELDVKLEDKGSTNRVFKTPLS